MKKNRYNIALLLLMMIVLFSSCEPYMEKQDRIYTKGEITKLFYRSSGSVEVRYVDSLGGVHSGIFGFKPYYLKVGEKYWCAYNKDNFDNFDLFFTAPIIEDTSSFILSKGYILSSRINNHTNSNDCEYSYIFNGEKHKRSQKLVDMKLKEGDKVDIFIYKTDPSIAYVKGNSAITK
jgi:hypothetical protein